MQPFDRLLRPRSIAVIGGGNWCANVIRECRKIGYAGPIWPVHPEREKIGGEAAFARVSDLVEAPDASFIGVNKRATIEVVRDLSVRGAGGAVCFASGFRESEAETGDGESLEDELLSAAGDMRILGPNCYGFINALDGVALWPDQHGAVRVERGVALVTQSSNIAINLTMQRRGLPLAYVVTVGNQAGTDLAEIGRELLEDPRVTTLGLYIEGIGDLRRFEEMAEVARELSKPIVALKVGASDQAKAATVSHTASMAGSNTGARALFDRLGIGQVSGLSEFLETLKLLHVTGALPSNRIASMSCSGGEASLVADGALGLGLEFPALNKAQKTGLRAVLGDQVALANPLDYHTNIWGEKGALARCFTAMMEPDMAIGCVVLDFPRADRCSVAEWNIVVDAVGVACTDSGVPMALVASLPECMPEAMAERAILGGLVPFCGLPEALKALSVAAKIGAPRETAKQLLVPGRIGPSVTMSEADAKLDLSRHGLLVPEARNVLSVEDAIAAAEEIGYPVALKGEGAAHKTDAGLIALGLGDAAAVRGAFERMDATEFLVEEMITGAVAELLVGVFRDPAHGFVLTLAAGGTLTEIMSDTASLLLPVTENDVSRAINELKIAPLLKGYRGVASADHGAILRAVMAVQDYAVVQADRLAEVEVNPLICLPNRAVAADALIRLESRE